MAPIWDGCHKVRYGKRLSDGKLVVAATATHEDAPFICPDCDVPLVLRKGDIRVHHFAHRASHDRLCGIINGHGPDKGGEGAVHKLAKLVVSQLGQNVIITCPLHDTIANVSGPSEASPVFEYRVASYLVDVAFLSGENLISAIEIYHTHRIDRQKYKTLVKHCDTVCELDAKSVLMEFDLGKQTISVYDIGFRWWCESCIPICSRCHKTGVQLASIEHRVCRECYLQWTCDACGRIHRNDADPNNTPRACRLCNPHKRIFCKSCHCDCADPFYEFDPPDSSERRLDVATDDADDPFYEYICEVCGEDFNEYTTIYQHMMAQHPPDIPDIPSASQPSPRVGGLTEPIFLKQRPSSKTVAAKPKKKTAPRFACTNNSKRCTPLQRCPVCTRMTQPLSRFFRQTVK